MRIVLLGAVALVPAAGQITAGQPVKIASAFAGEGPAWNSGEQKLYFTGRGRISTLEPDGSVKTFREGGGANGLLFDRDGRLIACEAGSRRVTRTEKDGTVTVLADRFEGRRFNSPNDLTMDSRGRVYFSDPRYGKRDGMEMDVEGVYRIDAPGRVARVLGAEVERANGVLVSPGDQFLYVADNHNNRVGGARKLWRFALRPDGSVEAASRKLLFDWEDGRGPDGVKMDSAGRLFVAGGLNQPHPPYEPGEKYKGGVYVLAPEGKLLEFIPAPVDEVTNCAFGGKDLRTLFITSGGTLWSVALREPGRLPAATTPRAAGSR